MGTRNLISAGSAGGEVQIFGFVLMHEIIGNYALRMAGIYMTAIAALWGRTGTMPRWLILVTYVLAWGFLFAADRVRESRFIFPAWVFIVSVVILVLNYRHKQDQEEKDEILVDK
jgi:hypothetical protein